MGNSKISGWKKEGTMGFLPFGRLDYILMGVVAAMAVPLGYIPHPKWKAFVLTLPVPFSIATLSLGRPVGPTHIAGLLALLLYAHSVRILHHRMSVPIIPSIILSAAGYCAAGVVLARLLPDTSVTFWVFCVIVFAAAIIVNRRFPFVEEPGDRTSLPVYLKTFLVLLVVVFLVLIKSLLQGFMALFPMVGVFAAYESRRSLCTLCRHIPALMMLLLPMIITIYIMQNRVGIGLALTAGWAVFLVLLGFFLRKFMFQPA